MFLSSLRHMKVGVHLRFQNGQWTKFGQFRCVCIEVEATGDQRVKSGIQSFSCRCCQIGTGDGSKFRTNENGGSFFSFPFHKPAFGGNETAGPAIDGGEGDPIVLGCLMNASQFQVIDHHLREVGQRRVLTLPPSLSGIHQIDQLFVVGWNNAVRGKTFNGKRTGHSYLGRVPHRGGQPKSRTRFLERLSDQFPSDD